MNPESTEVTFCVRGVVSPLLANVYLHYVFDLWVRQWRHRSATGDMVVVRYADDIVLGFEQRSDAERFLQEWRDRMRQFGLELHPDKTRLIEFGRHAAEQRRQGREQAGDVQLSRVHPSLWDDPENRSVHRQAPDYPQTTFSQAQSAEGGASASVAHASRATRAVVALGRAGLVQLPRGAGQYRQSERLPQSGSSALVPRASATGPTPSDDLGSVSYSGPSLASQCQDSAPSSERAL